MFNAWRFDGAPFAGSARSARVLFAASTFAALATVSGGAMADRAGASALDGWAGVEPTVTTYRAGSAHGHVLATFEPGRPWDLVGSDLAGITEAEADGFRIGAGVAYLDATAGLEPFEVIYNTSAILDAHTSAAADGYTIAKGAASLGLEVVSITRTPWGFNTAAFGGASQQVVTRSGTASVEADPLRIHNAGSTAPALAGFTAEGFVHRGGICYFDGRTDADVYALINGVHESYPEITAHASMSVDGTREARSPVEADVRGEFLPSPVPWLGSQVEIDVAAEVSSSWWAHRHFQLTLPRGEVVTATNAPWGFNTAAFGGASRQVVTRTRTATVNADSHKRAAGGALMDVHCEGSSDWTLWIEPSVQFIPSTAFKDATALRITNGYALAGVTGFTDFTVHAIRHVESGAVSDSELYARAFVNFTHDAPDWRSMTVPAERRAMVVPYENRMMVVR